MMMRNSKVFSVLILDPPGANGAIVQRPAIGSMKHTSPPA